MCIRDSQEIALYPITLQRAWYLKIASVKIKLVVQIKVGIYCIQFKYILYDKQDNHISSYVVLILRLIEHLISFTYYIFYVHKLYIVHIEHIYNTYST